MKRAFIILLTLILLISGLSTTVIGSNDGLTCKTYTGGEAVARIAQSYYQSGVTFYYNDGDLDFANKGIDCSTFASLCLKGLAYSSSPYVGIGNYYSGNGAHNWETGLDNHTEAEQVVYTQNDKYLNYNGTSVSTRVITYAGDYLNTLSRYMTAGPLYYSYNVRYNSAPKQIFYLADSQGNSVPFIREFNQYGDNQYSIKRAADLANYYARDPENTIVYFNPIYYTRTLTKTSYSGILLNKDEQTGRYSSSRVSVSSLQPGDLVFWSNPSSQTSASRAKQRSRFLAITHVAIVSIDGKHVYEATSPSSGGSAVKLTALSNYRENIVLVIRPKFYEKIWVTDDEIANAPLCETKGYSDFPGNHFWHMSTDWALRKGVYRPQDNLSMKVKCTRAETVLFIWRALGCPNPDGNKFPFTDVTTSDEYYTAVKWAYNASPQITAGTSATTFGPNAICTRAQVVTLLWKAIKAPVPTTGSVFNDVPQKKYYYQPVSWAVQNGITSGTSESTFSPNMECDRSMIITFLYRCVHNWKD